jgi:hypothetical protein
MRNLLGRLHARRLPELLRIAEAWRVPLHVENKAEVVGALYRAMIDPRAVRDVWAGLDPGQRAIALALADAPEHAPAPTVGDLAARLGMAEEPARETALGLYRMGILAREGDEEPLPIGVPPRLILPRELALHIRRIQDELAAGNLAQSPLRVLIELLDDGELESAARAWGLRTVPGVARREELAPRLLRLVDDRRRVERVVRSRGRDAAAIWRIVRAAPEPVPLAEAAGKAGLAGTDAAAVARLRAALAELEGALLVWHAYHRDGSRWLFVPHEIRSPGEAPAAALPPLEEATPAAAPRRPWRHPDALAWDLLTLLRIATTPNAPVWELDDAPPRWLRRAAASRLWFHGRDGPPAGYLELLQALALGEGVLAVDEEHHPPRIVAGPHARAWRSRSFAEQTARLRGRWLRLPRWVEGEPAGQVEVWGADWRGMRPRLLAALADAEIGLAPEAWVSVESLALRIAARYPSLLGPSFTVATARHVGEGADDAAARAAALSDAVALELTGPFTWFGLTETAETPRQPRAICLTPQGAALAARKPLPAADDAGAGVPALEIAASGEITLRAPSPARVWALSAFAEPVDLGVESHYRLTPGSIAAALGAGIELEQIVAFLEQGGRQPLTEELRTNLAVWVRGYRRVRMERAILLRVDDPAECGPLVESLAAAGWRAEALGERTVLVPLSPASPGAGGETALVAALRAAGHAPHWAAVEESTAPPVQPDGQIARPDHA